MLELKGILLEHAERYPEMLLEDLVKLVYQNEFGCGHFVTDEVHSLTRLEKEFREIKANQGILFENIGNGFSRLNLSALDSSLLLSLVNRLFIKTAQIDGGSTESFEKKLKMVVQLCCEGLLAHDPQALSSYLKRYRTEGYPPVSHSEVYRRLYSPGYRVISSSYALYFSVFSEIEQLLRTKDQVLVAIDGMSGSGKSTLGQIIQSLYSCPVFSMDHFFLRPEQRTESRLHELGGNVDYERFKKEVIGGLRNGLPFSYQIYDCQKNSFEPSPKIEPHPLNVVEGSYSMHPTLVDNYDLKVFLAISSEKQKERILKRNGPVMLERFLDEWIPLENRYFTGLRIQEKSDVVISSINNNSLGIVEVKNEGRIK